MRSNALKSEEYIEDPIEFADEMAELRRRRIVLAAEEAANLAGNKSGPDLEEFALKYNLTTFA